MSDYDKALDAAAKHIATCKRCGSRSRGLCPAGLRLVKAVEKLA